MNVKLREICAGQQASVFSAVELITSGMASERAIVEPTTASIPIRPLPQARGERTRGVRDEDW
jgi:hypothetical protein